MRPPLPDADLFGDRISPDELREWRAARRISQRLLAEMLQVAPFTVQRWEAATYEIPGYVHLALRGIDEIIRLHRAPPPATVPRRRQRRSA